MWDKIEHQNPRILKLGGFSPVGFSLTWLTLNLILLRLNLVMCRTVQQVNKVKFFTNWFYRMVALGRGTWLLGGRAWLLPGGCMVAPRGRGLVWLLGGGACMVALGGGMHGCSLGGACVVALGGGHVWLLWGGMHGFIQGGHAWFYSGGVCMVFSVFWDTMRYGQWEGGTHPTGMHSCY